MLYSFLKKSEFRNSLLRAGLNNFAPAALEL